MRCDLHVHSWYSGPADLPVLKHIGRECYSEPVALYEEARRRGMDLVTLTDHDTIEGALALAHLPDAFVSEEVTVLLPGGRQLHVNVFDLSERQHERIQALRRDPEALFAYLAEERLPASVNHLFSALTGERTLADLRLPLGRLPLIETLNGSMPEGHNEYARRVGRAAGMAPVGGSDSHTLAGVGRAFTTVAGARTREEFLEGLCRGLTVPSGRSGSYARLTAEVVRIFAAAYREVAREAWAPGPFACNGVPGPLGCSGAPGPLGCNGAPWGAGRVLAALALGPLLPMLPLFTVGIHLHETRFGNRYFRAFQRAFGWPAERQMVAGAASAPVRSLGPA
jgi:predicted metal-dependent phosphoesterase TrpH